MVCTYATWNGNLSERIIIVHTNGGSVVAWYTEFLLALCSLKACSGNRFILSWR